MRMLSAPKTNPPRRQERETMAGARGTHPTPAPHAAMVEAWIPT